MAKKAKAKAHRKRTRKTPVERASRSKICFVIMPFGGWLDEYYTSIYCPAIKAKGLDPHRADDLFSPSTITNDIWNYTKRARLLVADLTGKNPNVFYELGLAHALGRPAILISESLVDIPFDLRALRVIIYDKNAPNWGQLLRESIEKAIDEVLKKPVSALLPTFLDVKSVGPKTKVSADKKEILEMRQELDLFRQQLERKSQTGLLHPDGPEEARSMIALLLRQGMSTRGIINRVQGPPDWVHGQIRDLKKEMGAVPSS